VLDDLGQEAMAAVAERSHAATLTLRAALARPVSVTTPRATILVDTCSGNDKERPHKLRYHRRNWPYLANLAAAGFAPEDIDYVPCTHCTPITSVGARG